MCNVKCVKCVMNEKTFRSYIFDFEKLDVYKKTIEFVKEVFKICKTLPKEYQFTIGHQFIRASLSIANNIAEGSGKESKKGKIQFYNIALNSGRECVPMITLLFDERQISKETYQNLRNNIVHICNMIGKLIKILKVS